MKEALNIPGGKIESFDNDQNLTPFGEVPMEVENSAQRVYRFFSITKNTRHWEFLGLCSRECVQRQGIIIASLRGQLKGLHRARRQREHLLEARIVKIERQLGLCQTKFSPGFNTSVQFPLDTPSRLG